MLPVAFALLLVGCHQRQPAVSKQDEALARAMDAEIEEIRAGNPGIKESCLKKLRTDKMGAFDYVDNPDCFDMTPPRRWSGMWDFGWEWSDFCEDPAKVCGLGPGHDRGQVWTDVAPGAQMPRLPDGMYHVEFIGRRTRAPGHFGHLNQYDYLMIVDRIISIKKVPGQKYTKRF